MGSHTNDNERLGNLLARVSTGDREAFAELYTLISGPVFGTVRRIVRDPTIAEEVAHDILIEVWNKASGWDADRGTATVWIHMMARRRAVDRVRSEQALRDRTARVGIANRERDHDHVADVVVTRSEQDEINRHLNNLTELQREAIALAFYEGRTQREISHLLDVPLGTIKTRIRDGLNALRKQMGEES